MTVDMAVATLGNMEVNAPKPGVIVKPSMRGASPTHWAHALRGHIVEALLDGPLHTQQVLVKWHYEELGEPPLAAYWMFPDDVEVTEPMR